MVLFSPSRSSSQHIPHLCILVGHLLPPGPPQPHRREALAARPARMATRSLGCLPLLVRTNTPTCTQVATAGHSHTHAAGSGGRGAQAWWSTSVQKMNKSTTTKMYAQNTQNVSTLIKPAQKSCTRNQSSREPISTANTGWLHEYYLLEEEQGRRCMPWGRHTAVQVEAQLSQPGSRINNADRQVVVSSSEETCCSCRTWRTTAWATFCGFVSWWLASPRRHAAPHPTPSAIAARVFGEAANQWFHAMESMEVPMPLPVSLPAYSKTLWIRTHIQQLRT
jgi:hypothetical protein